MTEPSTTGPSPNQDTSGSSARTSNFKGSRVLKTILPFAIIMVAVVGFFGFFDGTQWLADLVKPSMVEGRGRIMYQGAPLSRGELTTQPADPELEGAIGFLDDDGRFILETEIRGVRIPGAYVGTHKARIRKYGPAQGGFAPLVVPEKYASFEETPLTIVVSKSPGENVFEIALEDDPNAPVLRQRAPAEPGADNAGSMTGAELTRLLFAKHDSDGDGLLTVEELQSLSEEQREAVLTADADGDGSVGGRELTFSGRRMVSLFEDTFAPTSKEDVPEEK